MDLGKGGTESVWVAMEDRVMGATVCVEAEVDWAEGSARGTGEVAQRWRTEPLRVSAWMKNNFIMSF